MNDPKLRYLIIEEGATLQQWFVCKNETTGAVYDLAAEGYVSGRLQVRDDTYDNGGELLLDLNTNNGGVVFGYVSDDGGGNSWSGYLYAPASAVDVLVPIGDAIYDFFVTHNTGVVQVMSRGPVLVIPRVTK